MTLPGVTPQRRLGPKVDELPSEVSFVLRYILVERRRQSRVVPCSRFGIVVNKVYSRGGCQPHLPTTRQGTELADGLRLDRQVALLAGGDETQELLTTRVNPCRRTGVVIDEVRTTFGSESLFPTRRQRTLSGSGSVASVYGVRLGTSSGRGGSATTVRTALLHVQHFIRQCPLVVPRSGFTSGCRLSGAVRQLIIARAVPCRGTGVVIDIVLTAKMVNTTFPTNRQWSVLVRMRIEFMAYVGASSRLTSRSSLDGGVDVGSAGRRHTHCLGCGLGNSRCNGVGRSRNGCFGALGGLDCRGGTRDRLASGVVRSQSRSSRRRCSDVGGARSGGVVRDRSVGLSREVNDQFALDRLAVGTLFELLCEHLLTAKFKINDIGNFDIDHTKETLVLLRVGSVI